MLYSTFLYSGLSTIVPYPEEVDPEFFYLRWPVRKKCNVCTRIFWKKVMVIISF